MTRSVEAQQVSDHDACVAALHEIQRCSRVLLASDEDYFALAGRRLDAIAAQMLRSQDPFGAAG